MCSPIGDNWRKEQRAVTLILVDNNTSWCTGCLVNNTQQDFKPYILSARHCFFDQNLETLTNNPGTNIFRFQYWRPSCGSGNPSTPSSITGAALLAHHAPTDMALLQLTTKPPVDWNVYYAGWDRTATPAQTATGIHHPKGDALKISHEQHPVVAVTWNTAALTHWFAQHFEQGTIQKGSSGSPLFNQSNRIVGQLSGRFKVACDETGFDQNTCDCDNRRGYYGRFNMSWTGGNTNTTHLSTWLAPIGTAPNYLDGITEPYIVGASGLCPYRNGCSRSYT